MARYFSHCIQDTFISNATRLQLAGNHLQPLRGVRVAIGISRHWLPRTKTLFFALTDSHIEADHTVLITQADDRNVAANVVFHLDDLL